MLQPGGDGPPARFGHEALWVPGTGLVVWAGQRGSTFYDDLWAYDPAANAWEPLPGDGDRPTARYGSCAVYQAGAIQVSHGFTSEGQRFADTRAYDLAISSWADVTPPGEGPVKRCLHGCWLDGRGRLVLYGGQTNGVAALGDLWTLDGDPSEPAAWQQVGGDLPAERRLYAHAPWMGDQVVVGGGGLDGTYLDDAYVVDGDTLAFRPIDTHGPVPAGRSGAELVADPTRGRLLLFGGRDASGARDDLWILAVR
jgi:hypothetical protein